MPLARCSICLVGPKLVLLGLSGWPTWWLNAGSCGPLIPPLRSLLHYLTCSVQCAVQECSLGKLGCAPVTHHQLGHW